MWGGGKGRTPGLKHSRENEKKNSLENGSREKPLQKNKLIERALRPAFGIDFKVAENARRPIKGRDVAGGGRSMGSSDIIAYSVRHYIVDFRFNNENG